MKKGVFVVLLSLLLLSALGSTGQIYRSAPAKINDLTHTRLDLHFDYSKCYVHGKAWLTLKPHFNPIDTLRLDAKGMDLENISILKNGRLVPLKFSYDSLMAAIRLDRVYHQNETYTVFIQYTAKPNNLKVPNDARTLFY